MFCGPMEVERNILLCSGKSRGQDIEVVDVLRWSISETCINTRKCIPLWATQGMRYQRHHSAWTETTSDDDEQFALDAAETILKAEAQSLQDRY